MATNLCMKESQTYNAADMKLSIAWLAQSVERVAFTAKCPGNLKVTGSSPVSGLFFDLIMI